MNAVSAELPADVSFADGQLNVSGVLNFDTVPDVLARTASWVKTGTDRATIDLARVQRADSAGLALMVEWLRLARSVGRTLMFAQIPEQVRQLIRVNGLGRAFNVDNS